MLNRKVYLVMFIISISLVTVFSLIPDPPSADSDFPFFDKIEHLLAYTAMSFLLLAAISGKPGMKHVLVVFAILSAYGLAIEFFQQFTGRSPEVADFFADLAGISSGSALSVMVRKIFL